MLKGGLVSRAHVWLSTGCCLIQKIYHSVTPEKVKELLDLLQLCLQKQSTTLKELPFVAPCVQASTVFIARILNWVRLIHSKKSAQSILPSYVEVYLLWWSLFYLWVNDVIRRVFWARSVFFLLMFVPQGMGDTGSWSFFVRSSLPS